MTGVGHLSSSDGGRTISSYRGIGLLLRVTLKQHYRYRLSAYCATVLESWTASGRNGSNNKSSWDTHTINPFCSTQGCSHCVLVAAAIRNEKSDLSGSCLDTHSSAFAAFCGVVWLQPQSLNSGAGIFEFCPTCLSSHWAGGVGRRHQWTSALGHLTLFSFDWRASETGLRSVCTWNQWSKF